MPRIIEYNCRFGDPETQPIMMRLQSDLVALCNAAIDGQLDRTSANWDPRPAVGVVLAAKGYPDSYPKGDVIGGLDTERRDCKTFHAGTQLAANGDVLTNGGRVLCVTALGSSVSAAQQLAYAGVADIRWDNLYCRRDIGYRAIEREQQKG